MQCLRVTLTLALVLPTVIASAGLTEITPPGFSGRVLELRLAPDQTHVVFLVSQDGDESLWWGTVDGSSTPVIVSGSANNISDFTVSPGSDRVAFTALAQGLLEVWVAAVDGSPPVKVSTASVNGRAEQPRFTADGSRVLYREGPNGGFRRLWSAPSNGGTPADPISPEADNCSLFELPADPATVVYHTFQPADDRSELWMAAVDGSGAPDRLSLFPGDPGVNDEELMAISDWRLAPDHETVVYIAQRDWPDEPGNLAVDRELYSVSTNGPSGSEVRLDLAEPPEQRSYADITEAFAVSPDGSTVVFQFDRQAELSDDQISHHLYSVPIDGAQPPTEIALESDHVFNFEAAAGVAVYLGGDTTLADSLRSVSFSGGAFVTLDGDPVSSRVVGDAYLVAPDGGRVIYPVGSERALWSIPADGAGGPVELTPPLGFSGDVQPDFEITGAGSYVVFRSDLELSGTYELYAVPAAGGTATKLNHPATTGRRVWAAEATSDERCVVFTVESASSAPRRLFAADLDGECAAMPLLFSDGFESGGLDVWSATVNGG